MRNQMLRRAILQLLYERALEAPQSLIVGIEAREIVLQLGMTNKEFAFNALYLDGKGLITNDRASNGGELQLPLTEDTGAHNPRLKSHPYRDFRWVFARRYSYLRDALCCPPLRARNTAKTSATMTSTLTLTSRR